MSPDTMRFEPLPVSGAREQGSGVQAERARTAGYAAGWAAGAHAAAEHAAVQREQFAAEQRAAQALRAEEHKALVLALERACAGAGARTIPVLVDAQRMLQEAALELAEVLIGAELSDGERSARAALRRALSGPVDVGPLTVRLYPDDARRILAATASGELELPDGVTIVADPGLAPGDAVSVHENGYLDARIGTAVERVRAFVAGEGS